MAKISSHRDLTVWQRAYALGLAVCRDADRFPRREQFALASQIRRCAVSVPSNIAEGFGRGSRDDYLRYLKIARGSLFEFDTQLCFARDLSYIDDARYAELHRDWTSTSQLLAALIRRLEQTPRLRR